jgi:hypothetical protein
VDGGGGTSGNGALGLAATIGQPDAGTLSGSDFILDGGFRMGVSTVQEDPIFSDGFETGDTSRWSNQHPSSYR